MPKKAIKNFLKKANRKVFMPAAIITSSSFVGGSTAALSSRITAPAHGRSEAATEGAKIGAITGAMLGAIPTLSNVVFRRIKGRIIPIRKKA